MNQTAMIAKYARHLHGWFLPVLASLATLAVQIVNRSSNEKGHDHAASRAVGYLLGSSDSLRVRECGLYGERRGADSALEGRCAGRSDQAAG
jgi:hypothetical protein